ncbi:mechanosensitive ion channel [Orbus sturtevantii]|uniref:mechanosensitive ion channel family protein n=1 Tax=Orbus sturtevantii TaxID=3074109 RepID=UPI00370D09EF
MPVIDHDFLGFSSVIHRFIKWLNIPYVWQGFAFMLISIVLLFIFSYIFQKITHNVCRYLLVKANDKLHSAFFKYLLHYHFLRHVIWLVNIALVESLVPLIFFDYPNFILLMQAILSIYIVFIVMNVIMSFIQVMAKLLAQKRNYNNIPFDGYLQVIRIILISVACLLVFSILTHRSLVSVMTALGAASAILILLFKDTVMGFVGSVQITMNNLVHEGDWITVSQYGADGIVKEISLTTIKILNYDNTLTTVPTYSLASGSFQNWRAMQESGNRRFVRNITIISKDIRFLTDMELEHFKTVGGLSDYIMKTNHEYQQRNAALDVDKTVAINLHQLTNCDLFMEYARWYLNNHPKINSSATQLVRQIGITDEGVQLQIYAFTNTCIWAEYEAILAEVMGHLLSSVSYFDLQIYAATAASDSLDVNLNMQQDVVKPIANKA